VGNAHKNGSIPILQKYTQLTQKPCFTSYLSLRDATRTRLRGSFILCFVFSWKLR